MYRHRLLVKSSSVCSIPAERRSFLANLNSAQVIPIHKKGESNLATNNRPISLLPVLSKIIEKRVLKRMISFIDSSHILNRSQYGFRANHDYIDAVSVLTSNVLQAMDNNMITIAIMVDISKAFDNLDHKILLDKLSHYGFRGCSLQWFSSFLSGRSQVTCYNSTLSSLLSIISGVPQGAVLSPLLFSLYQ